MKFHLGLHDNTTGILGTYLWRKTLGKKLFIIYLCFFHKSSLKKNSANQKFKNSKKKEIPVPLKYIHFKGQKDRHIGGLWVKNRSFFFCERPVLRRFQSAEVVVLQLAKAAFQ